MRFNDIDCEVLFRSLDRPEDIKKLLSLELTGAYINEAREVPKQVLDMLSSRVGRYPSPAQGGATWFGIWMDTNPWHAGHWGARYFESAPAEHARAFRQPGGRSVEAENVEHLPAGTDPVANARLLPAGQGRSAVRDGELGPRWDYGARAPNRGE